MKFQVPQFIEVEDKIFGPLTIKQFIYLIGGAALCFLFYRFLPFFIAVFFIIPSATLAGALAFYKVNGKPFIAVLEAALKYVLANKLYIWKKEPKIITAAEKDDNQYESFYVPKLSDSKLRDLTWNLDISHSQSVGKKREDQE